MSTSDLLCITNRKLCSEDFFERLAQISACHPKGIVLREKDLSPEEYELLAIRSMDICNTHQVPCILHSFADIAEKLHATGLHLPLHLLRAMTPGQRKKFSILGASCHSTEDAKEAEALGCTYITAGHIFETDCKKGLPGRGLAFLHDACSSVSIPVYAIGGICPENIANVRRAGATGACLMSSLMCCPDVPALFEKMK